MPKKFDTFVVNYNIQPEKWDMERLIAMCVQEEERMKATNGGTINYVKDNKKKNTNANSSKLSTQNFRPMPRTHTASRKGLLDGAVDPPSFSARMVDPAHSSRDMPVNLTLQLPRREIYQ